eukprot:2420908-Pleurochrysis_carterae.AAC.1
MRRFRNSIWQRQRRGLPASLPWRAAAAARACAALAPWRAAAGRRRRRWGRCRAAAAAAPCGSSSA